MSRQIGKLLSGGRTELVIDLKPALEANILEKRILRDLDENKNRAISTGRATIDWVTRMEWSK